jgi:probable F420-dependent oxidoreductase
VTVAYDHHRLGRIGVWSSLWSLAFRSGDPAQTRAAVDAATEAEALGYGTIWLGTSPPVEFTGPVLNATERVTVATGITPIWDQDAAAVAARYASLDGQYPGRLLIGLGVSHGELKPAYRHPYPAMRRYLAELDGASVPVPADRRILAALGPRMLTLSRERALGAHPYLVTVDQVAWQRAILGPDPVLAPEFTVVLDPDLDRARSVARRFLGRYLGMANYLASFRRDGFTDDDFRDGGSDRLLDAVFAMGGADAVAGKIVALLDAGADHVAIQAVTEPPAAPQAIWRELARFLPLSG